ncbi:hypothetical protein C9374_012028 [Naegleria lovaniensis]|uniref:F-box domain-containing protein n=1 Tax=Naegleria lovaniensis TaxID=51637 RepID=A0AA88KC66_NAELO|nr:uncharacterized protein C9374_012028 [Naegleria lovaniensis]KAG2373565.1 hypothetical protein C9374_012028 [Naegleria lovaniensis]
MKRSPLASSSSQTETRKTKKIKKESLPSFILPFHEMVTDDLLALIFKYISEKSSFANIMLVSKHFRRVLFSVELNCFEFTFFYYREALQMPDFDLVRVCGMNYSDLYNNHQSTDITSFPFNKLKYINLEGFNEHSFTSLVTKLNTKEIEHICYDSYLCTTVLRALNEFSNLKTLEVADISEPIEVTVTNSCVTTFKLNEVMDETASPVGYDQPIEIYEFLENTLPICFPNLQTIEFEPVYYYLELRQLLRLLIKPTFRSLKKLKIHVIIDEHYDTRNENFLISSDEWKRCRELKRAIELELTCEYSHVASLLLALFVPHTTRMDVMVVPQNMGSYYSSLESLIGNIFASKQDRNDILQQLKQGYHFYKALTTYHDDYESPEENEEESDDDLGSDDEESEDFSMYF